MAGKATSFYKGQIAVRPLGQTTCVVHRQVTLDWFCETCTDAICADCISATHKGHTFIKLDKVTLQNKRRIKTFIYDTEQTKLAQIQQEINSTKENLKNHLRHFETFTTDVRKQGEKLKEELDFLIAQTLSRVKHLEEEGSKLLITYQKELEEKLDHLKDELKQCKESLQNGTDIQVFDLVKGLDTKLTLPRKPSPGHAKFTPNRNPKLIPKQALGTVTFVSSDQFQGNTNHQTSNDNDRSYVRRTLPAQTSNTGTKQVSPAPQKTQLQEAKVLTTWKAPDNVISACTSRSGGILTCDNYSHIVTDLSRKGEVERQIRSPVKVTDICISPVTNNLWACSQTDNSTMELVSGTFNRRFNTKDSPLSLCVASGNRILVGTAGKITEYTLNGTPCLTTATTQFGKPLVCTPQSISQCPVSGNVAVVDLDKLSQYSEDEPHIIVIDTRLQEVYQYGRQQHMSRSGSQPFDPWDLAYDSQGCLVVSDFVNRCLHLLDGDGLYLQLVHVDKGNALSVSVDAEGILWAVFSECGKNVKLLQYRELTAK